MSRNDRFAAFFDDGVISCLQSSFDKQWSISIGGRHSPHEDNGAGLVVTNEE